MEAFVSRKRRRLTPPVIDTSSDIYNVGLVRSVEEDSTDLKLAILSSLHPEIAQDTLLDCLIAAEGSVEAACRSLATVDCASLSPRKRSTPGYQTSLSSFAAPKASTDLPAPQRPLTTQILTKKGRTLYLYSPEDIAAHTPCSIIHNFLPAMEAEELLRELLDESPTFEKQIFKLFDNVVQSPHSACFYVHSLDEQERQKTEYLYNGSYLTVSRILFFDTAGLMPICV